MPFDATSTESEVAHAIDERIFAAAALDMTAFSADARRLDNIQRFVSVVAALLFGVVGLVAGTALVALMLVALIIPTTMGVALAFAATATISVALLFWMKKRARIQMHSPLDAAIGLPV